LRGNQGTFDRFFAGADLNVFDLEFVGHEVTFAGDNDGDRLAAVIVNKNLY
jgi:hypothetical protein